jgi:hypothetical protein
MKSTKTSVECPSTPAIRILTVGEGDFSCSLAILRAYPTNIQKLVATTLLPSEEELVDVYPHTTSILTELKDFRLHSLSSSSAEDSTSVSVEILFGVDATQLHINDDIRRHSPYDYILFHHPHLGYGDNDASIQSSNALSKKHSILLAHYLYSAKQIFLSTNEEERWAAKKELELSNNYPQAVSSHCVVHVCLCAGQSKSWGLQSILRRLGLEYSCPPRFASKPLFPFLNAVEPPDSPLQKEHTVNTKTGCIYWLAPYGYTHQATHPSKTKLSSVINSHHHFFQIVSHKIKRGDFLTDCDIESKTSGIENGSCMIICEICNEKFSSPDDFFEHMAAPALPQKPENVVSVELGKHTRARATKIS